MFDDVETSLPVVSKKPTIIFGADVTHPAALDFVQTCWDHSKMSATSQIVQTAFLPIVS